MHTTHGGKGRSHQQPVSHEQARQLQTGSKSTIFTSTMSRQSPHTIPGMVDALQPSTCVSLVDLLLNPSSHWLSTTIPRQTIVLLSLPCHFQQPQHQQLPATVGVGLTGRDSTPESGQPIWISPNSKERTTLYEQSPTLHGLYTKQSTMLFH
jgi:hypothetical protein